MAKKEEGDGKDEVDGLIDEALRRVPLEGELRRLALELRDDEKYGGSFVEVRVPKESARNSRNLSENRRRRRGMGS